MWDSNNPLSWYHNVWKLKRDKYEIKNVDCREQWHGDGKFVCGLWFISELIFILNTYRKFQCDIFAYLCYIRYALSISKIAHKKNINTRQMLLCVWSLEFWLNHAHSNSDFYGYHFTKETLSRYSKHENFLICNFQFSCDVNDV